MNGRFGFAVTGMMGLALGVGFLAVSSARAVEPPEDQQGAMDEDRPPRRGPMGGPRMHDGPPPGHSEDGMDDGPRRPMRERRGEGPDGGRRWREGPPELTDETLDKVMALVADKFPIMHQRLTRLREENPERFRRTIGRMVGVYHEYQMLKERHPEMAETLIDEIRGEQQLADLIEQHRAASGDAPKQAQIETTMREAVRTQVNLMLKRREARLADFGARIAQQQERLAEEQAKLADEKTRVDELVNQRLEDIKAGKMPPKHGPFEGRGFGKGPPGGPGGPGLGGPDERRMRMRDGKGPRHPRPRPDEDMPPEDGEMLPPPPPPPGE